MNETQVLVRSEGEFDDLRSGCLECVIGREVRLKPQVIQDFSAKIFRPEEQDLALVAGVVAYTDRKVRRRRGSGWVRHLRISLPVNNPDLWSQPEILESLLEALHYVTGDHWSFQFRKGAPPLTTPQSTLNFSEIGDAVVPFSDGLDSYLQWRMLAAHEGRGVPLRVHTKSSASNSVRYREIDRHGNREGLRLSLPVAFSVGAHPEPSFRTRTFLFYSIAALAAAKVGASRVVIGENGVGALGPSLLSYGDEHPHRTTHPAFTRRLIKFVNCLLGTTITIEHPQVMRTKGSVMKEALERGIDGWQDTRSCIRGPRDRVKVAHCGVCNGCLLRRSALNAAGLRDAEYFWDDLSARSLDDCRRFSDGRRATSNDCDIASHAIHSMDAMAHAADLDTNDVIIKRSAWELASCSSKKLNQAAQDISNLARAHAIEWRAFKGQFSAGGILS